MKILQINNVYKKGSTGKITYDLHNGFLKKNIDSLVIYGRGKKVSEYNVFKISNELYSKFNNLFSRITGIMYGGCYFSTNQCIKIIKKQKPDIIILQCINGYFINIYRLLNFLKRKNIQTILVMHAEFMYTANCGHALNCNKWIDGCNKCPRLYETKSILVDNTSKSWKKMSNCYKNFNNIKVITVSPWLEERVKKSPFFNKKNIFTIYNGVDTNIFKYNKSEKLKQKLNLSNKKIIFHPTALFSDDKNHLKGGYYILKMAEMLEKENYHILVAGKCDKKYNNTSNMTFLGMIKDQKELAAYYSISDVTIITSQKETFSMPVAESLCCGIPVVGFKAGAPEMIAIKEYSEFVSFGDIKKLVSATKNMANLNSNKEYISTIAKTKYSKERMIEDYLNIISIDK